MLIALALSGLQFLLNAREKIKYIYVMIVSKACMLLPKERSMKSNGKKTDITHPIFTTGETN
jgi:hypothetical protein